MLKLLQNTIPFNTFVGLKNILINTDSSTQQINLSDFGINGYGLFLKREDLIHPFVSGNKFRKLKYNIAEAFKQKQKILLTYGGAYSNHIVATAAAGKVSGLNTIGIIRGEELHDKIPENPTLTFAQNCGMHLKFISREMYKLKDSEVFQNVLIEEFGRFYQLPEGGTNSLAIKGCEEILTNKDAEYDYICTPVGTGGTIAGLVKASKVNQKILGFSALKGSFQSEEIKKYTAKTNFDITDAYSFGGYGKIDVALVRFINEFKRKTGIPLDPVYTGKMIFGIMELLKDGYFKENSRIFAIHTGGLQGIAGMNVLLKKKNLPIIE